MGFILVLCAKREMAPVALHRYSLARQALREFTCVAMRGQRYAHFPPRVAGSLRCFCLLLLQALVLSGVLSGSAGQWQRRILPAVLLRVPAGRAQLCRDALCREDRLDRRPRPRRLLARVGIQEHMPALMTDGDVLGTGRTPRTVALVRLQSRQ